MMVVVIQCFEPDTKGLLVKCVAVVWGVLHCVSYPACPCYITVRASDEKTPIEAANFSWSPPLSLFLNRLNTVASLEFVILVPWSIVLTEFVLSRDYFGLTGRHFRQCVYMHVQSSMLQCCDKCDPSVYYSHFRKKTAWLLRLCGGRWISTQTLAKSYATIFRLCIQQINCKIVYCYYFQIHQ
jgi:hypothetical protein